MGHGSVVKEREITIKSAPTSRLIFEDLERFVKFRVDVFFHLLSIHAL